MAIRIASKRWKFAWLACLSGCSLVASSPAPVSPALSDGGPEHDGGPEDGSPEIPDGARDDGQPPRCADGTPVGECIPVAQGHRAGPPWQCALDRAGAPVPRPNCEICGCPASLPACTPAAYASEGPQVPVGECLPRDFLEGLDGGLFTCRLNGPALTGSIGLAGADLGVPVWHDGTLVYLFGDASGDGIDNDPWARSAPRWCPELSWVTTTAGSDTVADSMIDWDRFVFFDQVYSHVPSGGISWNGALYVFMMHQEWVPGPGHTGAYLVRSVDSRSFEAVSREGEYVHWLPVFDSHDPDDHADDELGIMGNVAPLAVALDGVPQVCFLSSGQYGASAIYCGCTDDLEDIDQYRFFAGLDAGGRPQWSADQSLARPVIDTANAAEISLQYSDHLGKYVMTYGGSGTGVYYGSAPDPWGPWEVHLIPELANPSVYVFYAGYIVPQMSQGDDLYLVVSLWYPYTSYIVRFDLDDLEAL